MQDNYETATSPYAKFKTANTVTPAREAYEIRDPEKVGSRWGSAEVERVSIQRTAGTETKAVLSQKTSVEKAPSVPLANEKQRSISPLRAELDP